MAGADEGPAVATGLCGTSVVVDGERLLVEDTVLHAVVARKISDEFLDHGSDTYWCVNSEGRHRLLRAAELFAG